jgi:signal transduction histidine kinase
LGTFSVFVAAGMLSRSGDPLWVVTGAAVALVAAVPLFLLRPRFPLAYAAVATVGVVIVNRDTRDVGWFAVLILAAWCLLQGGRWVGLTAWIASAALFGGEWLWDRHHDAGWGPWVAGVTVTELAAALIRHELVLVERLRAAQAGLAERSRAEERNRIARDLHDVIAHSLTVSLLHVTSARLAVEHDPSDAARALAEAERLGRQSLAEVRATMGLLSSPGGSGSAPVPGAAEVTGLVQQVRDAGADVSLRVEGNLASLPATTGLTVYRIVQEALTNASRHAPGAAVTVGVTARRGQVDVCVDSAGSPQHGSGMVLASMRERAEAVGGTCTAGPGGHGWTVQATLPLLNDRSVDGP